MSLELNKLTGEINALGETLAARSTEYAATVVAARAALRAISPKAEDLQAKIDAAMRHRWAGAIPTGEPIDRRFALPPHPARVNVIAADGSQVYPDRHGLALYYLINIGSIVFRHGLKQAPTCSTRPHVFYDVDDLYDGENLIASALIDARRDIDELRALARLAAEEAASAPTLALLDNGLLLYFSLQVTNRHQIEAVLRDYLAELTNVRGSGAAVVGVVDRPRAASVIRLLRLAALEVGEINDQNVRLGQPFEGLTDRLLFDDLQPGERSAVFVNASPANIDHYQPQGHEIRFFYVNAGAPGRGSILRLEIPQWVAEQADLLNLVHAGVVEQSRTTGGFPYVLMRAHELAVMTTRERRDLDQMVMGAMVREGLLPEISRKAQGKAWSGGGRRRFA